MALAAPLARPALALALAVALAAPGCAGRPRYPAHLSPEALEARGLRIVGAKVVDRVDVAGLARCRDVGTPEASCDFDVLWALYDLRGHPRASFSLRRVADEGGHAAHELVVDEGPLFRVLRVELEGLDEVAAARSWAGSLPLLPGRPFSAYAFMQTKDELVAALRGAGWPDAEVYERVDPDLAASKPGVYAMVARYAVAPGARGTPWRVGEVFVADPDPARRARVERELAAFLRAGEPFDYGRFLAARDRLRAYPTAQVLVSRPDDPSRQVRVLVRVTR